ncbi:MAG: hypothetical protein KA535_05820 [Azonexus sp.]|nr:hypothetical protein [Azonexus sp.]
MCKLTIPPSFYEASTDIGRALSLAIATSEMVPAISTDSQLGKELEVTSYLIDLQRSLLEKLRDEISRLEGELMKLGMAP